MPARGEQPDCVEDTVNPLPSSGLPIGSPVFLSRLVRAMRPCYPLLGPLRTLDYSPDVRAKGHEMGLIIA